MQACIPSIEHRLRQFFIIQEKASTEVVDGFFGLRKELIGDERHMIACLAEQLWEERIVAPFAFLTNNVH